MGERILLRHYHHQLSSTVPSAVHLFNPHQNPKLQALKPVNCGHRRWPRPRTSMPPPLTIRRTRVTPISDSALPVPQQPLDLTEDNVRQVLAEARVELSQLFDDSVGITGQAELAELDGPFVKISLKGRFWHKRSTVVARLGNYLKQRIPEILEVDIEDEKQLDDSPENF
ncbi:hypothetical protein PanWU01x14_082530 [Parasponia andersonii]|uniref:Uncharacterized protein n=1 Tax=Parasponia andersonii TaxID=3476 RepID=A0A2P5D9X0_PARAD|nr:hypothetical protein PanWU01x14_082530 [Parasponia andersonii]